ncbi:DUF4232 domain-containing protein [Streptomyces sp. FXJ1.172]|uniref:DUF4232 domain-containing protein n=1 Tax=Streptomyces sp. FXJ1.172 TaxID=710705 RepID=UPI0007CF1AEC|nr:DUF4232 domain-containing protein [Streptomyces sp. FXJ1.172]WEO97561.1 DUF4232 domain-containing protein [Streptomyces sp. FXJ1.172]
MLRHANALKPVRPLPRRGAATVLTAALLGLTAAGAAWGAPSAAGRTPASVRTCTVSDLHLSMGRKEGAAGSLYQPIRFTNTGTTDCALRGYPGVSVLDTAHRRLGPAATRSGRSYGTVTLAPGHWAASVIRTANGPVGGPCLRTGAYLRVYPPASRAAVLIPAPWTTCSGIFQVGPVNVDGVI